MNKILFLIGLSLLLVNCVPKDINQDPYGASNVMMNKLPQGGTELINLQNLVLPVQENSYQYCFDLGAGIYSGYVATTMFFEDYAVYNPRTSFASYPFDDTYPKIYAAYRPLLEASKGNFKEIYFSWGTILRVGITHWLTDSYGPLPYSTYTDMESTDKKEKSYDSQEKLYLQMCEDLQKSIETLRKVDPTDRLYADFDKIYGGDFSKWVKYANSLLLRISIRMSKAAPVKAKEYAEYAVRTGVIESNADNAVLKTTDNPVFKMINLWKNSVVNAEIVEYMRAFSDPRSDKYFTKVRSAEYKGLRSGIKTPPSFGEHFLKEFSFTNLDANSPMCWITASEVAFLKAEGALNGWNMKEDAASLYKKGIELSFEQWGVSSNSYLNNSSKRSAYKDELYPALNHDDFLSPITVNWADAGGDKEKQLARIITQKWIAMFPYGAQEAWAEWRRTGYPNFMSAQQNSSANTVKDIAQNSGKDQGGMRRIPYSQKEKENNTANVLIAIDYLGGADTGGVDMWWVK